MTNWQLTRTHDSPSGTVRWDRFGSGPGEPVVLLHGTPFSSYVWHEVARSLARFHPVYVWDMPGYGLSEKSERQDISLAAQVEVFTGLLDHWGLTRPLVVAHDMGGAVALGTHLLNKVPYRRLALVDVVAVAPWGSTFFRQVGEHGAAFEALPPRMHAALLREYISSASSPGLRPDDLEALAGPWLAEGGQAAFYRQIRVRNGDQAYTDEMEHLYRTIDLPVLVGWGEDDDWIPLDRGRELAARIPGADLHLLPGAGHLAPMDASTELTTRLLGFLGDLG